jgi:TetR/AcrR family transcriptional repressor of nem operon
MTLRDRGTRDRILDLAQAMVQTRGYNAVSFLDIAKRIKVKTASVHYHFPTKADLGTNLVRRYRQGFDAARAGIDAATREPGEKLAKYFQAVEGGFRRTGRMCLCGVLAAEASTLPKSVATEVQGFFTENEAWIAGVLAEGVASGAFGLTGEPGVVARWIFAGVEGALMSAWTFKDPPRLESALELLLHSLRR